MASLWRLQNRVPIKIIVSLSLRCQKAQHRGRATQCALRVDRALEDEVMLATGALRGAGRNSISGSRARSSIGEAAAHRP